MGKVKSALMDWNEENGYEIDQTYGWDYRNKKALPTMEALVKVAEKNRKKLDQLISTMKLKEFQDK